MMQHDVLNHGGQVLTVLCHHCSEHFLLAHRRSGLARVPKIDQMIFRTRIN
jgi:hypothetical protein